MSGNRQLFFMPETERPKMLGLDTCGDFMPFYHEGVFYLYYLHKYSIYEVTTTDFIQYSEPRMAIACGSPEDQDWHIGTGGVIEKDGVFHFYYTGFNEGNLHREGDLNEQVLMRAISSDLKDWSKDPGFFVRPDKQCYGNLHWRDPQPFRNEEAGEYWLVVTATEKDGLFRRGGCTHVMRSDDLDHWRHGDTIYAPRTFETHECHDLFRIGDWWYMVFSNYTRWWETRYRMARSPEGPWITPAPDDMFDGRAFYAAKTVSDGSRRYLVGWQAIRANMDDKQHYQWGGSVLVHELIQRDDGLLGVKPPETIRGHFRHMSELKPTPRLGEWTVNAETIGREPYGFGWLELGPMPAECLIRARLSWSEETIACGLMLRTSGDKLNKWCQVRIEPRRRRLVFDRSNKFDNDHHFIEERYFDCGDVREAELTIIASGNVIVIYANDTALAARAYDFEPGSAGLFVESGEVRCAEFGILEPSR
ncbi:hypothetical protein [Cohnella sp.]|uniref:hypothetical protein n=1 Tax=Cohnella sp. TaxID=1883426 RepID=UPI0035620405